jgi:hypothetical protein
MIRCFPGWRVTGSDLNESFREQIVALGRQVSFRNQEELEHGNETFDVVSLIHCLEHIRNPSQYLERARRYIGPIGILLIEVPDAELNPFDLVVADHASHFSKKALASIVETAGYEVIDCGNQVIGKEITLVACPLRGERAIIPPGQATVEPGLGHRSLSWLQQVLDQAQSVGNTRQPFGVFGTSIAGVWIGSALGKKIQFFVDEDESRVGRDYFGTPILAPAQVPAGATVFVCLEPNLAQAIAARHGDERRHYVVPPAVD